MIKGTDINLIVDQKTILKEITFEIPKEKITVFIGPSGAGKTSLLKCIANLYSHYQGTLLFNGSPIKLLSNKERAQNIGFIFQQFNLFGHMTVLENCSYPLTQLHNISPEQARITALEVLTSLCMESYANVFPAKLSGGQQQRVAIARALCLNPKILLLDEPSSALDPQMVEIMTAMLKKLCHNGRTIAISSHDMNFVQGVADRIYYLEDGLIKQACNMSNDHSTTEGEIAHFLRI